MASDQAAVTHYKSIRLQPCDRINEVSLLVRNSSFTTYVHLYYNQSGGYLYENGASNNGYSAGASRLFEANPPVQNYFKSQNHRNLACSGDVVVTCGAACLRDQMSQHVCSNMAPSNHRQLRNVYGVSEGLLRATDDADDRQSFEFPLFLLHRNKSPIPKGQKVVTITMYPQARTYKRRVMEIDSLGTHVQPRMHRVRHFERMKIYDLARRSVSEHLPPNFWRMSESS